MDDLFLKRSEINNLEEIIRVMLDEGILPNTLSIEHIADIISHLDRFDKRRDLYDPELKKAVFTIIKEIISKPEVELVYKWSSIPKLREVTYVSHNELFKLLDEYWEIYKDQLTDRDYMLWFKKTNSQISNN